LISAASCSLDFVPEIELNSSLEEFYTINVGYFIVEDPLTGLFLRLTPVQYGKKAEITYRLSNPWYNPNGTIELHYGSCEHEEQAQTSHEYTFVTKPLAYQLQVKAETRDGLDKDYVRVRVQIRRTLDPTGKIIWEGWTSDTETIHYWNLSIPGDFRPFRQNGGWTYSPLGPSYDHFVFPNGLSPALLRVQQLEEQARQRVEALHCKIAPSECPMRAFAIEVEAFNFSEYDTPFGPISYNKEELKK